MGPAGYPSGSVLQSPNVSVSRQGHTTRAPRAGAALAAAHDAARRFDSNDSAAPHMHQFSAAYVHIHFLVSLSQYPSASSPPNATCHVRSASGLAEVPFRPNPLL